MKTVSVRKQLIRLLGSSGIRDFKTQEEMTSAHALYQQFMRNDAKADTSTEDLLLGNAQSAKAPV